VWKDLETKTDLVNHKGVATAIVGLIRDNRLSPLTIGVHGDWGSGKSTVLEMVRATLEEDANIAVLSFNGWLFQGFEDAKIALMEAIIGELERDKRWGEKVKSGAVKLLKRVNWLKVARKVAVSALALPTGGASLVIDSALDHAHEVLAQGTDDDAWLKDAAERDVTRQIHDFRIEFRQLLVDAQIEQLVVVVDDLDRCLPSVAIETLEALRLFLFVEGTTFIIAADETLIEYAVRQHFPGLPYSDGPAAFTRNYLEKLIQVPFRLPPMSADEAHAYIALLFVESAMRDKAGVFDEMLSKVVASRGDVWKPLRVDAALIEANLSGGRLDDEVRAHLLIADRVARPLANGTSGNPRQIKRFLNTLMLRMRLGAAYGMQASIKEDVLAKIMLLERFNPTLYRVLVDAVRGSDEGAVADIDRLADEVAAARPLPEALAKSTAFFEWTRLDPRLGGIDLRPYLFVSREGSPGYIGESTYVGIPEKLVKRFVQATAFDENALERDLKGLSGEQAERLLDIGLTDLRGKGALRELDGGPLRGLAALVRSHTHLQASYVDAISAFPLDSVGAFMPLYMNGAITLDEARARYRPTEDRWHAEGDNLLKEAVVIARRQQRR
jgi:predicted KAP-like P-loop ATPase